MNFIKENHSKIALSITLLIVISGSFYWFQWRPMQIKKECSWVKNLTSGIPELTENQINQAKIDYQSCKKIIPSASTDIIGQSFWDNINMNVEVNNCANKKQIAESKPHLAVPPEPYYTPANSTQSTFCLHSRGL